MAATQYKYIVLLLMHSIEASCFDGNWANAELKIDIYYSQEKSVFTPGENIMFFVGKRGYYDICFTRLFYLNIMNESECIV